MHQTASAMDILHVTEACGGGVARHLELILPALHSAGHSCSLFAFGKRVSSDFRALVAGYASQGILQRVDIAEGAGLLAAYVRLGSILSATTTSHLHLHAFRAGLVGRLAASKFNCLPVFYSPHSFGIFPGNVGRRVALKRLEKQLSVKTSCYVLVSEAELLDASQLGIDHAKCAVAPNGLPVEYGRDLLSRQEARQQLGIALSALAVGVPCRLAKQKNLPLLLTALSELCHQASVLPSDFQLWFCGDGAERRSLERLVAALSLSDMVFFAGHVSDLPRLLRAFDLVVLPSLYEGFSYAWLEAVAAGVPLLVSDIPANLPTPQWRQYLWVCKNNDRKSLAETLTAAVQQSEERRQKATQAAAKGKKDFTLEKQIAALIQIYLKTWTK